MFDLITRCMDVEIVAYPIAMGARLLHLLQLPSSFPENYE